MARRRKNDEFTNLIIGIIGVFGMIIYQIFLFIKKQIDYNKPKPISEFNNKNSIKATKKNTSFQNEEIIIEIPKNKFNIETENKNKFTEKMTSLEMAQFIYRCKGKKDNIFDFPKYMYADGRLREKINFMLENGYLRYSEYKDELENLTVSDLKTILKEYKLKSTGKKSELIDRILENGIKRNELLNILKTDVLLPTDKGKELIENNKWWEE